jgi:hypothetical protein
VTVLSEALQKVNRVIRLNPDLASVQQSSGELELPRSEDNAAGLVLGEHDLQELRWPQSDGDRGAATQI